MNFGPDIALLTVKENNNQKEKGGNMKQAYRKIMVIAAVSLFAICGQAEQRIVIDMDNYRVRQGDSNSIGLRRLIKQQRPNIRLNNFQLNKVIVVARSRNYQSELKLRVNGRSIDSSGVPIQSGFNRVRLNNYGSSNGRWKLDVYGPMKIRKIIIKIQRLRGHDRDRGRDSDRGRDNRDRNRDNKRSRRESLGSFKAAKLFSTSQYASLRRVKRDSNVRKVIIKGLKARVHISSAYARTYNGNMISLPSLVGRIKKGRSKEAFLNRRRIDQIIIESFSTRLNGSSGRYEVIVEIN